MIRVGDELTKDFFPKVPGVPSFHAWAGRGSRGPSGVLTPGGPEPQIYSKYIRGFP